MERELSDMAGGGGRTAGLPKLPSLKAKASGAGAPRRKRATKRGTKRGLIG